MTGVEAESYLFIDGYAGGWLGTRFYLVARCRGAEKAPAVHFLLPFPKRIPPSKLPFSLKAFDLWRDYRSKFTSALKVNLPGPGLLGPGLSREVSP